MERTWIQTRPIIEGEAIGTVLWTGTGLSFWGGVDAAEGTVIDRHHPLCGQRMTGKVLCIPRGRGSCSSSGILLEMIRIHTAPAAIVSVEAEGILAIGAVIGQELYGRTIPICTVSEEDFKTLEKAERASVSSDGSILLE